MSQSPRWVILKFGGTSVSTLENWQIIASQVKARIRDGMRPVVVCSAFTGVSNSLEKLVDESLRGFHEETLQVIEDVHFNMALQMGLLAAEHIAEELELLRRISAGISLLGEVTPRLRARVLATGELMSTRLGAAWLAKQGLDASWVDAREFLEATDASSGNENRNYLSATCDFSPDSQVAQGLSRCGEVIVTQGFIARSPSEETVLLGRGGSDTSAAYFASILSAERCEIWTDVPGMYTANPRQIPSARLLRELGYDEAQEIASSGAKVLHPRCIAPVRQYGIPLHIRCTPHPELEGTVVSETARATSGPEVKAIAMRSGVTLISMDTPGMWQQVGFLADIFVCFKSHGLSIDLVSTSEMNVTVSLDSAANVLDDRVLQNLLKDLEPLCLARVIGPCSAISLVGRGIRAILHKLGPAFELFEQQKIHLLSQAASDLNLTFVVDSDQAERVVQQLHELLLQQGGAGTAFGPAWAETFGQSPSFSAQPEWWRRKRSQLLAMSQAKSPLYVYDRGTVLNAADRLNAMASVDRVLYAVKANPYAPILQALASTGIGFECVSPGEIKHVIESVTGIERSRILFTPNFAPQNEYVDAFEAGVLVTVDNLYPLKEWPEVFAKRDIFVRVDPGQPRGHHHHVKTAGTNSKFGVPIESLPELVALAKKSKTRVVGLHAHRGSGIRAHQEWAKTGHLLSTVCEMFPEARVLDLGGGLGVPERSSQMPLDLAAVEESLKALKTAFPHFELWLEPGRYLVAEAGVLLTTVTQTKRKADSIYVGVDTGMNSLIRPALYGAWHDIVNLSRLDDPESVIADVVGPICESGDTLGRGRRINNPQSGDTLLIGNAGAYGRSMSSNYNLREPAAEVMVEE